VGVVSLSVYGQSVQPFYVDKDVVFKPELVGKWGFGSDSAFEFRDVGDNLYGIDLKDLGSVMHFRGRLIHLGRHFFLDVQISGFEGPETAEKRTENVQIGSVTNGGFKLDREDIFLNRHHGLILLEFTKNRDEFIGHVWKDSWLPEVAEKKKLTCPYVRDELGRILLTGDRLQLRKFAEGLPLDAFGEPHVLSRDS